MYSDRLSEIEKRMWLAEGFFGKLYLVFDGDRVVTVYEGKCDPAEPFTIALNSDRARLYRLHTRLGPLDYDGGAGLSETFADGRFAALREAREYFSPVSLEETKQKFPCITVALK